MNYQNEYKASINESHHKNKKDKPSGTAIKLANDVSKNIKKIKKWSLSKKEENILNINCDRKDDLKGMHEINYTSNIDTISLIPIPSSFSFRNLL